MNNKNKYPFVKILITVVILVVILTLSIPGIKIISNKVKTKKYNLYKTNLLNAAKIYIDKKEKELFSDKQSICNIITYDELIKENLIKDIDLKNTTCNSENTFVQVNKWKGQYYYKVSLGCGENKNKKLIDEELSYKTDIIDKTLCLENNNSNIIIASKKIIKEDNKKANKIKITSFSGISPNAKIYYSYSKTMNYNEITNFKLLPIKIPKEEEQIKQLKKSNTIEIYSEVITPEDKSNGEYYLIIKSEELEDLEKNKWTNAIDNTNYLKIDSIYIDVTKPEFNDSKIVSDQSEYNGLKPSLELNVQDDYSQLDKLKMCISLEKDNCPKNITDFNKEKIYVKYQNKFPIIFNKSKLDGSKHKIYVTVVDEESNYNTKEFEYQFAFSYTIKYKNPSGLSCNPNKKTVNFNDGEAKQWGELCTPSKEGMIFMEWNTSKEGTGETITKDSIVNKSLTVYAVYKSHICMIIYDNNEGEFLTNNNNLEDSCDYHSEDSFCNDKLKSTDTFFNARRDGYHLTKNEEWISGNGQVFSDSKKYTVMEICKNIAIGDETVLLKANWKKD